MSDRVGKTPFSGNTPFSSQTGGKQVQNASFRDISVLALQNAPRLHTNQTMARSNGVFPTAGLGDYHAHTILWRLNRTLTLLFKVTYIISLFSL